MQPIRVVDYEMNMTNTITTLRPVIKLEHVVVPTPIFKF